MRRLAALGGLAAILAFSFLHIDAATKGAAINGWTLLLILTTLTVANGALNHEDD